MMSKTILVTGGTSGIGRGIAASFNANGNEVFVMGRNRGRGEAAEREVPGLRFVSADVRDAAEVEAALAPLPSIDVLVNAAAGNFAVPAANLSPKGFRAVVEIDLIGTFNVCRLAFERLRKPGAIVLNVSAPQATVPTPLQIHACAAKAGIEMITRCLALEWGPLGIRVVSIVPGVVEGTEGVERLLGGDPVAHERIRSELALRRTSTVSEVASVARWLASEEAPSITGTSIVCDGGLSLAGGGAFVRALFP